VHSRLARRRRLYFYLRPWKDYYEYRAARRLAKLRAHNLHRTKTVFWTFKCWRALGERNALSVRKTVDSWLSFSMLCKEAKLRRVGFALLCIQTTRIHARVLCSAEKLYSTYCRYVCALFPLPQFSAAASDWPISAVSTPAVSMVCHHGL
jgi:hypothetical protein